MTILSLLYSQSNHWSPSTAGPGQVSPGCTAIFDRTYFLDGKKVGILGLAMAAPTAEFRGQRRPGALRDCPLSQQDEE